MSKCKTCGDNTRKEDLKDGECLPCRYKGIGIRTESGVNR